MLRYVFAASVMISCVLADSGFAAAEKTSRKPNIIFILSDDLSYGDLSCLGQEHYATPNLDRLAHEGMIFQNAYAGAAWCAPSRTALLTGRNSYHNKPLARNAEGVPTRYHRTVAEVLKDAGYATGIIGKWHMAEPKNDWAAAKFDNTHQMPWSRGFDVCRITMRRGLPARNWWWPSRVEHDLGKFISIPGNEGDKKGLYGAVYESREAVKFIEENRDNPFFLYYATPIPHGPLYPPPGENRFEDQPWTEAHKEWAAIIEALDESVGAIMQRVRELGLSDRTYIFFSADNGYSEWLYVGGRPGEEYPRNYWGVHRPPWTDDPVFKNKGPWYGGKFMSAIGGLRVPFIAWGPGLPAGTRTDRAINFYDFKATAAELAGEAATEDTDGVSFVPLLKGKEKDQPLREFMVWSPESNFPVNGADGVPETIGSSEWRQRPTGLKPDEQILAGVPKGSDTAFHVPASVLLDEKWFAMQMAGRTYLFDILKDPGMEHNLATEHPELCRRARRANTQQPGMKCVMGVLPCASRKTNPNFSTMVN